MLRRLFLAAAIAAVTVAFNFQARAEADYYTVAELLGAIYGTIIGHADICGYTIKKWHADKMGEHIAKAATSDADRRSAIVIVQETVAHVMGSPTMSCSDARAALRASEIELGDE